MAQTKVEDVPVHLREQDRDCDRVSDVLHKIEVNGHVHPHRNVHVASPQELRCATCIIYMQPTPSMGYKENCAEHPTHPCVRASGRAGERAWRAWRASVQANALWVHESVNLEVHACMRLSRMEHASNRVRMQHRAGWPISITCGPAGRVGGRRRSGRVG